MDNEQDNSSANNNRLANDYAAIMKAPYRKIRRLVDLDALILTGTMLQIDISATHSGEISHRSLVIMRKSLQSRLLEFNKHKAKLERINASKVNKQREQRDKAHYFETLSQSGVIPELLKQTREYRSERAKEDIMAKQLARASFVTPMRKILDDAGFNPLATSEERNRWAKERELKAIPGTDLSTQGEEMMTQMRAIEQERSAKLDSDKLPAEELDINPLGSADEWIAELPVTEPVTETMKEDKS